MTRHPTPFNFFGGENFYRYVYNSPVGLTDPMGLSANDNNGNAQTKVVGTNTTSNAWDFENRMTSVTLPAGGGTVTLQGT